MDWVVVKIIKIQVKTVLLFFVWFLFTSGNILLKFHSNYKVKFILQYTWFMIKWHFKYVQKYTLKSWNTKQTLIANYFTRAVINLRWCCFQIKILSIPTRPKEAGRMRKRYLSQSYICVKHFVHHWIKKIKGK